MLQISKQAVHQRYQREQKFLENLSSLLIDVDILRAEHPGCGVEKMYYTLRPDWIGRDRFIALMMEYGYRVHRTRSYFRTTIPVRNTYPNFIEGMIIWDKNQLWQSDITYIFVGNSFYYLVFIEDVYTKLILGYQASNHLLAIANLAAQKMALRRCNGSINGLIHHSDRGSQYTQKQYVNLLLKHKAHISMGLIAQDNAYAERINGIIKNEYLKYRKIETFSDLQKHLKQAVNHYNRKRIHRSLPGKISPEQFEEKLIHLSMEKRPKIIVYSKGNQRVKKEQISADFIQDMNHFVPICPLVFNEKNK
jgi:putative transposase